MIKDAYTRFREKGGSKSNQTLTAALVAVQPRIPHLSAVPLLFLKARHISADIQGYSYPRCDFHH
jgi:sirohydrochlorin ferrochelatase